MHKTLRMMPARAAGVSDRLWSMEDVAALVEAAETKPGKRGPYKKMSSSPSEIAKLAADRAFGSRLVTNIHRGLVVEAIVSTVLCPEWAWCSEDYYRFDFRHPCGLGLEVKQSAACQSWETKGPSIAKWDVSARKGYYEGDLYIAQPGRNAQVYILAWHPITDRLIADHRDPAQWKFFVIAANALPVVKSLGMAGANSLAAPVGIANLSVELETLRAKLAHNKIQTDILPREP